MTFPPPRWAREMAMMGYAQGGMYLLAKMASPVGAIGMTLTVGRASGLADAAINLMAHLVYLGVEP